MMSSLSVHSIMSSLRPDLVLGTLCAGIWHHHAHLGPQLLHHAPPSARHQHSSQQNSNARLYALC